MVGCFFFFIGHRCFGRLLLHMADFFFLIKIPNWDYTIKKKNLKHEVFPRYLEFSIQRTNQAQPIPKPQILKAQPELDHATNFA